MTELRVGILRGGCLLLFSFGLLLTSTGCGKEPAPADPAIAQSEPWLRMLATGDPPARVKALAGLAAIGHPVMAEPVLYVALNDHQPQVRIAAIDAMGKPGLLNPKQTKSLMFLMNSPDAEVRMAACRAVGAIGPPGAADALVQCMYDREASVRLAATDAIALLGPEAIRKLTGIFADSSTEQKVAIAGVLARMRDPSSAGLLTSALNAADDSVRSACVEALGSIGSTSAVPALMELVRAPLSQQNIDAFRQRLRERPSEFDFQMMIKLLDEDCERKKINKDKDQYPWLRSGSAYAPWYAKVIAIRQRDAANQVRKSALASIVKIAPPDLDRLLMELLSDPDDDVGAVAAQEFRARGDSVRPMLVAAAKDRNAPQPARRRAVDIIAPPPPPPQKDDANKLRMIVNSMDEVRDNEETGERQEERPPVVALPPDTLSLFLTLQTDPDPGLRAAVASHLGRAGVKEAIPPLLEAFRGADTHAAEKVVVALGAFKDDRIAPVLLPAIDDSRHSSNLVAIIRTLGLVGDKKATPALLKLVINGDDFAISCLALDSLAGIADGSAVAPVVEWFDKLIAARGLSTTNALPKNATPAEQQQARDKARRNEQIIRKAMDYFASVKAKEAVPSLTPFLTTDTGGNYGGLGTPAMVALGRIGDPRAVGPISELIAKGGSYHTRLYVNHVTKAGIDALVAIGDPGAIPVLKRLATNWQNPADPFTGKYAMEGLGRMKHPEGVQVLVNYLVDPAIDPSMKESCVGPALTMAGLTAKEPLLKLLKDAPAPPERAVSDPGMYAAQILAVLSKPDVNIIPSFASIIASKPPRHIAHRAVEGLSQTHHEAAVKALSDIVRSADTEVRQLAALALGTIKLSSAVPALESALKDPDMKVRECAAVSLTKYGVAAPADSKE